jgi:hypothetical protein
MLGDRGVQFRSLQEALDTSTASGRLLFHIMGSIAEFERQLIRDRTIAGLAAGRAVKGVSPDMAVTTDDAQWRGVYVAEGLPEESWPSQLRQ